MGHPNILKVCVVLILLLLTRHGAIAQAIEAPLFGITIRNATLEQRLGRTRTELEPVTTNIMDSDVRGQQTTTTETRLRIIPETGSMRVDVVSIGDVRSQTTGINSQALIDSTGQHHFEITKPVWFNGTTFLTQSGHGTIRASQAPQRVVSAVGATMPLLRPLSDRLAWEQVTRRQAEINQAVAEDVSRTVLPKIERIVDAEFAQLGRQLAVLREQVESTLGTSRLDWVARSAETASFIAAIPQRLDVAENRVPSSQAVNVPELANGEEVVFTISDSVATALLAQYIPSGLILTDTQVEIASKAWNKTGDQKWTLASVRQLFQEIERHASAEPTAFSIQLANVEPIVVRFDRGDVCLETSFQIHPKGAAPSGWMKTTWRMRGRGVSKDQWAVALHQVDVGEVGDSIPVSRDQRPEPQLFRPVLLIPSKTAFESHDSSSPLDFESESGKPEAQVTTVESGTGWMSIVKHATQSLLKQIPVATLQKEFDAPTSLPGSPRIRVVRVESAGGVLRAAFRLVDRDPQP